MACHETSFLLLRNKLSPLPTGPFHTPNLTLDNGRFSGSIPLGAQLRTGQLVTGQDPGVTVGPTNKDTTQLVKPSHLTELPMAPNPVSRL